MSIYKSQKIVFVLFLFCWGSEDFVLVLGGGVFVFGCWVVVVFWCVGYMCLLFRCRS